ncbi:hypothetical protein [uncultured Methylophaga sp.]|uniref:hypothetical protein n=1 Tax=uncultured Methylophaga sp. TaxID=285271 RepID=UPI00259D2D55|nr:hypothetical protein [uncultured Methylophaga sp.]
MKGLLFFLIIAISPFSLAGTWVGSVSLAKEVSDDRSVEDVKRVCLDELKMLAASKAGSYLIETETISDSKYDQELKLVSSTFVQLENVEFNRVSEDGRLYLHSNARATVDLDEIERRVGYIRENRLLRSTVHAVLNGKYKMTSLDYFPENQLSLFEIRKSEDQHEDPFTDSLLLSISQSKYGLVVDKYTKGDDGSVTVSYFVDLYSDKLAEILEGRIEYSRNEDNIIVRSKRYLSKEVIDDAWFDVLSKKSVVFEILLNDRLVYSKPIMYKGRDLRFFACGNKRRGSSQNTNTICITGYGSEVNPRIASLPLLGEEVINISYGIKVIGERLN